MRTLHYLVACAAILSSCSHVATAAQLPEPAGAGWPDLNSWRSQIPFSSRGPRPLSRLQAQQNDAPNYKDIEDPQDSSSMPRHASSSFSAKKQTLQLQHILAHGAPRSKSSKVFRYLKVSDDTRLEMARINTMTTADSTSLSPGSNFEHMVQDAYFPLQDEEEHMEAARGLLPLPWKRVPNPEDQATVISMVRMALDCYVDPQRQGWVDIGDNWDVETEIGWLEAGLRGYIFASEDEKTVVLGIKGTSLKLFGTGGGPTGNNDKLNDNKMFSCCCGKVDRTWWSVCGCYMGGNQCNQQCLVNDLKTDRDEGDSYYGIGLKVIEAAKKLYPEANIWLTGHSLGGSVASTIGITHGYPAFTFQSPGDVRFAQRVGIVKRKLSQRDHKKLPVWQFGHTADPVFMGTCNGPASTCYSAGYALETKCHLGRTCVYDTVGELGWRQTIQAHTIFTFIKVVENWQNMTEGREVVPKCTPQTDCQDCTQWEYV